MLHGICVFKEIFYSMPYRTVNCYFCEKWYASSIFRAICMKIVIRVHVQMFVSHITYIKHVKCFYSFQADRNYLQILKLGLFSTVLFELIVSS